MRRSSAWPAEPAADRYETLKAAARAPDRWDDSSDESRLIAGSRGTRATAKRKSPVVHGKALSPPQESKIAAVRPGPRADRSRALGWSYSGSLSL